VQLLDHLDSVTTSHRPQRPRHGAATTGVAGMDADPVPWPVGDDAGAVHVVEEVDDL
jgi:hypothetical protein